MGAFRAEWSFAVSKEQKPARRSCFVALIGEILGWIESGRIGSDRIGPAETLSHRRRRARLAAQVARRLDLRPAIVGRAN